MSEKTYEVFRCGINGERIDGQISFDAICAIAEALSKEDVLDTQTGKYNERDTGRMYGVRRIRA